MKRLKIVIGIFLIQLICFFDVNSQSLVKDLLEDQDVTWMAETEIFFSLEGISDKKFVLKDEFSGYQNQVKTVKISPEIYDKDSRDDFLLQDLINESVASREQGAFDEDGNRLSEEEYESYFKTTRISKTVDSETREVITGIIRSDNFSTRGFIVKMLWYYNQKELSIHSIVQSFIPVTDKYINEHKEIVITAEGVNDDLHYNDEQVVWCKATRMNQYDFSKSKLLKGDHIQFLKEIFKTNVEEEKYHIYSNGRYDNKIFHHEALEIERYDELLLEQIDTFVSFNPETYEETIEVSITPAIDFKELNLVSFIHYWYWDEKSNALSAELKYIGLMNDFTERFRLKAKQD